MRNFTSSLAILVATMIATTRCGACAEPAPYNEVADSLPPKSEVHFRSVLALDQKPGAEPQLRGGGIARSADWPSSLFAVFETDRGTSVCTAALVGPQAMLTAAHCVPTSGVVTFTFAGDDFTTDCEQHPSYKNRSDVSADYAFCKVRSTAKNPGGVSMGKGNRFEQINMDDMKYLISEENGLPRFVTLSGYGCISDIVAEDTIDGKYRTGRTYFVETSDSTSKSRGAQFYAPAQSNNLMTVDDAAYANLCPGDSGGPAFAEIQGKRTIIGVNSRVFYRDATHKSYGASLVAATGTPSFSGWAAEWAQKTAKVRICGIAGKTAACK